MLEDKVCKEIILSLIKEQTAVGISSNPKNRFAEKLLASKPTLSPKATVIKQKIESLDFGCSKDSITELVSEIIGEKIVLEKDVVTDPGRELKIPMYSLLVCQQNTDDINTEIKVGTNILKISVYSDSVFSQASTRLTKNKNWDWVGLNQEGILSYCFCNPLGDNYFRFATPGEIELFVNNLPLNAIKFWFEGVLMGYQLRREK